MKLVLSVHIKLKHAPIPIDKHIKRPESQSFWDSTRLIPLSLDEVAALSVVLTADVNK